MAKQATWKLTLDKPDRYGRKQVRTVNRIIDLADFKDAAIFAWLVLAANPRLSGQDIQEVLSCVGEQHWRSLSWISRHRWMCHGKGTAGARRNADGLDEKARRIMEENPRLSSRQQAHLLRENGIPRSPEWVRQNRVAA
jgi:hypothetical protein